MKAYQSFLGALEDKEKYPAYNGYYEMRSKITGELCANLCGKIDMEPKKDSRFQAAVLISSG